jgi:pimeloyl-ACP methyl ester carboxylesterase
MARDLHKLLQQAGYKSPYILVGHSLAGVILRSFIAQYPSEVGGIVLVDASHPDQRQRFPPDPPSAFPALDPSPGLVRLVGTTGLIRIFSYEVYPGTKAGDSINLINNAFMATSLAAAVEEQQRVPALMTEARRITSFGDIPLIVITGTSPSRYQEYTDVVLRQQTTQTWRQLQHELLRLSTQSQQVFAPKSGHYVQLQQPELVTAAIRKLVNQVNASH